MNQSPTDLAALAHCLDIARQDPAEAKRIDARLARDGSGAWLDLAIGAACRCQREVLSTMPWENLPLFGDVARPRVDPQAAELLRRLLAAGLSRYTADPLVALGQAEAKQREPAK